MKTATLVQGTAEVITIVSLRPGDVFKRLVDKGAGYSDDRYKAVFGVVQSIDSNGEDTMVSAIEFDEEYGTPTSRHRVFGTDSTVRIFAATPDEIAQQLADFGELFNRKVDTARDALRAAEEAKLRFDAVVARHALGELSAPQTAELV